MQSRLSSRNTFLQPSLIRFGCAVDENAVLPKRPSIAENWWKFRRKLSGSHGHLVGERDENYRGGQSASQDSRGSATHAGERWCVPCRTDAWPGSSGGWSGYFIARRALRSESVISIYGCSAWRIGNIRLEITTRQCRYTPARRDDGRGCTTLANEVEREPIFLSLHLAGRGRFHRRFITE